MKKVYTEKKFKKKRVNLLLSWFISHLQVCARQAGHVYFASSDPQTPHLQQRHMSRKHKVLTFTLTEKNNISGK